jgi:hypothetical protein
MTIHSFEILAHKFICPVSIFADRKQWDLEEGMDGNFQRSVFAGLTAGGWRPNIQLWGKRNRKQAVGPSDEQPVVGKAEQAVNLRQKCESGEADEMGISYNL